MSYFDDDDNSYIVYGDEGKINHEKTLANFARLGSSLLYDSVHPSEDVRGAGNDRKQAQKAFVSFYRKANNKQYTFWECFKIVYGKLNLDAWEGSLTIGDRSCTVSQLVHGLEEVLKDICPLSNDQLSRKITESFSSFNPIQEYLDKLPKATEEDVQVFQGLAKKLFGDSQDQMAQVKLSRWLIGSVARALDPGCKMDTALVIRGKQGVGKTTLLQALFGKQFRTLHSHTQIVEKQRLIGQAWGCELGEIEATFKATDTSALKAFLTETHDAVRKMYTEDIPNKPRHCVFAGTTNETAFLNDPTGSRRFWIIDVDNHKIPVEFVKEHRDSIWAVALKFYEEGEQHWLTDDEESLNDAYNRAFQSENSFVGTLAPVLRQYERDKAVAGKGIAVSVSDVMTAILGIKPENHARNNKQVSNALAELGYIKKRINNRLYSGYYYQQPTAKDPVVLQLDRGASPQSANWATIHEQREYKTKQDLKD